MSVIKVFTAPTAFEAHFVRSVLEQHGVVAMVRNDTFSPYGLEQPEVWVQPECLEVVEEVLAMLRSSSDADGALSLAEVDGEAGRLSLDADAGAVSLCRGCGEENPRHFEICWRCGEAIA